MTEENKVKLSDRQQEVVRAILREGVAMERARVLKILEDLGKTASVPKLRKLIQGE